MERFPSANQEAKEEEIEINGFANEIRNMSAEQILEHFQRGFVEGIKHFDIQTLVSYIDIPTMDLEHNELATREVRQLVEDIKKDPSYGQILKVNPRLYFMTPEECAEMALRELVRRTSEEKDEP